MEHVPYDNDGWCTCTFRFPRARNGATAISYRGYTIIIIYYIDTALENIAIRRSFPREHTPAPAELLWSMTFLHHFNHMKTDKSSDTSPRVYPLLKYCNSDMWCDVKCNRFRRFLTDRSAVASCRYAFFCLILF